MKSGSQSAKSHIPRDMMAAKNRQKHYNQNQKSFITSMFTHNEFVLMTRASSAEESTYVMITYNIYIVIRETGQFSSKGISNDFIGNLNRLTVSQRFTEQAV